MKIAIASSGLGHVARGIETWARDTAVALSEVRCETSDGRRKTDDAIEVTLFAATPLPHLTSYISRLTSHTPPLTSHVSRLTIRILPCLKRDDRLTRFITRISPGFTWRWGWTSGYDIEQRSFWRHLWPILRDGEYDILHVQDPLLADLCRQYRKAGKLKTKEILGHGTEEPVEFLEKFDYVQHLAPWHLEQTLKKIEEKRGLHH